MSKGIIHNVAVAGFAQGTNDHVGGLPTSLSVHPCPIHHYPMTFHDLLAAHSPTVHMSTNLRPSSWLVS